jgi:hypothetical protein
MAMDETTGTVFGRPSAEVPKVEYTVTVTNAVGSAAGNFFLQTLVEPVGFRFQHPNCIYKEGALKFPAWDVARDGMLQELGDRLTSDTLEEVSLRVFRSIDADASGFVSTSELKAAFETWGVQVSDEEAAKMVQEGSAGGGAAGAAPAEELELDSASFLEIIKQAYYGFKTGADFFKTDPAGAWVANCNCVASLGGTAPFIFTVHPPLPEGLRIDSETGVIHGVPHHACRRAAYTITAKNRVGQTSCDVQIEVVEPPSELLYVPQEYMLPCWQPIPPITCSVRGSRDAHCGRMVFRVGRDPEQVLRNRSEVRQLHELPFLVRRVGADGWCGC